MKHLKRYLLLGLLLMYGKSTSAQNLFSIHYGLFSDLYSSEKMNSPFGIGIEGGTRVDYRIGKKFYLSFEYYVPISILSVSAYEITGKDKAGNILTDPAIISYFRPGLQVFFGPHYVVVPKTLSLSLGISGSTMGMTYLEDTKNIGKNISLVDPNKSTFGTYSPQDFAYDNGYNYGIQAGVYYRNDDIMFEANLNRGLRNITESRGFKTYETSLIITAHVYINEFENRNIYENKMLR